MKKSKVITFIGGFYIFGGIISFLSLLLGGSPLNTIVEQGLDFYRMDKQGRNVPSTQIIVEQGLDFYHMNKQGRNIVPAQGMSGA